MDLYRVPCGDNENEAWATYRYLCTEAQALERSARLDIEMGTWP